MQQSHLKYKKNIENVTNSCIFTDSGSGTQNLTNSGAQIGQFWPSSKLSIVTLTKPLKHGVKVVFSES